MKDFLEESTKNMHKTWSQWEQVVSALPGMDKAGASFLQWNPGIATMRYAFDMNMKAWKTFMEFNETTCFQVFKETPFHNEETESQVRGAWESVKKAVEAYEGIVETQLQRMEDLLKKQA